MEEKINQAIKDALENAPERKFVESVDISFTIKDVDLKNPNNRIKEEVRLPSGRGKELKIAMFAAGEAATKAKDAGIDVITPQEIEELGGKKGKAKKIANSYDFFLSEVPHMGLIGRYLGVVLGPRGKMPRPVPPTLDPSVIAAGLKSTVIVKSGDKMTFHAAIGTAKQSQEELSANAMEIFNRVISKLERGVGNIRSLYIKTSMGPAQRIEVIN
ncbi:MAG TPA: 50S ribosomal protein L1 [Candidatus Poseidoniaceae archaeon]|nr:50S ribosomal protein L1 [Flavobacteriales bacterium]DAC52367.1 MAG TPA: 50S ribosomal protein L1 [Candidatus Poseidoniales archaeon]DAC58985.1 MAG TPA: 50S ribosomal protein L1 [Candidatus Poseidoniales archaeon]HII23699.1 50S ribosomal protein L1 [Candidatus Poseidoniaceae archaeon]HII50637.1 50S ribosomal protein L1 [Candidatus Poseidoniaceae archaeon]|tara:strand:+ start:407 stop:1051 length:645 start_codon:yes stop_codon:yes gene_type:complete